MKKFLSLALVCVLIVMALISCGDTKCTNHTDADNDGKCDVCGADVKTTDAPCTSHVDANNDGKCDKCGATVEKQPDDDPCTNHVDANNDGKCDKCGATVEKQPEEASKFTVTFNKNGGGNMETVSVKNGETVKKPADPEKKGHTFLGWYVGDTEYDFDTKVTADVELKAKWQANKYNLVFGTQIVEVTYGEVVGSLPAVPAQEGRTGVWMVGDDMIMFSTVWYYTEDKVAAAVYSDIYYTVKLIVNGQTYKTASVKHGNKFRQPDQYDIDGYYTAGWTLDGVAYDFSKEVYSNLDLVATMKKLDYSDHIPNIEFSTTNTTKGNNSTFIDTDDGALQIGGSAWDQYTVYTINTPIDGQYIKTLTVRYKQGDNQWAAVILRLKNEEGKEIYINLSTIADSYSGFIKTEKDADGYVLATIDFANYASSESDLTSETFWKLADRTTTKLAKINIVSNNAVNNPTFDYVAFNVVPLPRTDYDPSYMTKRDDNSYYISNFDDPDIMEGVSSLKINPWLGTNVSDNITIKHGTITNGHGSFTGITTISQSNGYSAALYKLPTAFDLTKADTIVFNISTSAWGNEYSNLFFLLKSGKTYYTTSKYIKFYNGTEIADNEMALNGSSVINGNFLTGYVVFDVDAFLADNPTVTTIDGIAFGRNNTNLTHVLNEIYYTVK